MEHDLISLITLKGSRASEDIDARVGETKVYCLKSFTLVLPVGAQNL